MENDKNKFIENDHTQNMSVWHWIVTIGMVVGTVIEGFIPHSFGVLIANFQSIYNNTNTPLVPIGSQFQLNWLPVLSSGIPSILLPICTIIMTKYKNGYQIYAAISFILIAASCGLSSLFNSWSMLLFTYSFLYSIGGSIFLSIVILISAEYFPVKHKFHVLATSVYQIGHPIAALIGNPVIAILIEKYGWQTSLQIISLVDLVCGLAVAVMMKPLFKSGFFRNGEGVSDKTKLLQESHSSDNGKSLTLKSFFDFFRKYQIWPWLIGKYINYTCWYGLRTNIVTYLMKSTTFGLTNSALLMSAYAAAEIVVVLIASSVGDNIRGWLIHVHVGSTAVLAFITAIYTWTVTTYLSAVFLMISIGAAVQMTLTFGYPASVEVGNFEFDMKIGWIITNLAIGLGIISSPVYGVIMDRFGLNYLFYVQTCGWLLQTFLFGLTLMLQKNDNGQLK